MPTCYLYWAIKNLVNYTESFYKEHTVKVHTGLKELEFICVKWARTLHV